MSTSKKKQKQSRKQTQTRKQKQHKSRKQTQTRKQKQSRGKKKQNAGRLFNSKSTKEKKKKRKEEKVKKEEEDKVKKEEEEKEREKKLKEFKNKEYWHLLVMNSCGGIVNFNLFLKNNKKLLKVINKLNKLNLTIENRKVRILTTTYNDDFRYVFLLYTTENILIKEEIDKFGTIIFNPYN